MILHFHSFSPIPHFIPSGEHQLSACPIQTGVLSQSQSKYSYTNSQRHEQSGHYG